MPPHAHSVRSAAAQAWRDSIRAMKAVLPATAIALAICVGLALLQSVLKSNDPALTAMDDDPVLTPMDLVWSVVHAFLLTPYFIAVHRFIILDEGTRGYELAPSQTRFQRFFGWSLALALMWFASTLIATSLVQSTGARTALSFAFVVIAAIVSIRLITLFPAIAVDDPDAGWRKAAVDTRGHAGHVFGVVVLSALPIIVPVTVGVLIGLWLSPATRFPAWTAVEAITGGAVYLLVITIGIAVASRLYQRLGAHAA